MVSIGMYGMYCMYFNVFTSIVMYRKNGMYCTLYYVLIYLPSIDWYHYKIHAKYLHNTYQYIPRYMPKRVYEAKTRVLHRSCISMYLPLLSGMYWGMYWYVLVCMHVLNFCAAYWFTPSIHVLAYIVVCIGIYWVSIDVY